MAVRWSEVWVVWEHDYDDPHLEYYRFNTEAELQAFKLGVTTTDPSGEWYAIFDSERDANDYIADRWEE